MYDYAQKAPKRLFRYATMSEESSTTRTLRKTKALCQDVLASVELRRCVQVLVLHPAECRQWDGSTTHRLRDVEDRQSVLVMSLWFQEGVSPLTLRVRCRTGWRKQIPKPNRTGHPCPICRSANFGWSAHILMASAQSFRNGPLSLCQNALPVGGPTCRIHILSVLNVLDRQMSASVQNNKISAGTCGCS